MSDKKDVKNLIDPDALPIVSTGRVTEQQKEDFETVLQHAGQGASASDMYERYGKLVYLFDNSGSMGQSMAMSDTPSMYVWNDELLAQFRKAMKDYIRDHQQETEEFRAELEDDEYGTEPLFDSIPDDDEELKKLIIQVGLADEFQIKIPKKSAYSFHGQQMTKLSAVKKAARGFVEKRFERFPDANVMVFAFDDSAHVFSRGANKEDVLQGVENLDGNGGNTQIVPAVGTVINEFRRRPSQVRAHHVVLVTDGYDNYSGLMTEKLGPLQELGIVLDFIFVKGQNDVEDDRAYKAKIDAIKLVCEKTGGEYTEVSTVEDFEKKFLQFSNRPLLPAARS
jgi:hypothetical protein